MAQPILSINEGQSTGSANAVANLLPCHIHHDGSINPVDGYWKPAKSEDGSSTAYFRGRKLQGKTVALPEQYRGVIVERQTDQKQEPIQSGMEVEELDPPVETGAMQVTAEFDEMVIWGHETTVDGEADPYIRGIEEWLQVSEKIHSYPSMGSEMQK